MNVGKVCLHHSSTFLPTLQAPPPKKTEPEYYLPFSKLRIILFLTVCKKLNISSNAQTWRLQDISFCPVLMDILFSSLRFQRFKIPFKIPKLSILSGLKSQPTYSRVTSSYLNRKTHSTPFCQPVPACSSLSQLPQPSPACPSCPSLLQPSRAFHFSYFLFICFVLFSCLFVFCFFGNRVSL